MSWKNALLISLAVVALLGATMACSLLGENPLASQLSLATAVQRELRLVVSTNGIIEPIDRAIIYAPFDGFVTNLEKLEGASVSRGEVVMRLESKQLTASLAEARAGLLQARLQAMPVLSGPAKIEIEAVDAAIAENELQLNQKREALKSEEALLQKGAVTREAVENLTKELKLLQLRSENLRERKQVLLDRFSPDQKRLEEDRIVEITRQVKLLEEQLKAGTILAPRSGILYALAVREGSYASRGQQLAEVYEPGKVRLRAYVDEPDLGAIARGQPVQVEWDGLQDRQWQGTVARTADQVVVLGNRSVGYVLCSIEGDTRELIPNINVKVRIVTAAKSRALVIPRSCVHSYKGQPAVLVWDGKNASRKSVGLGLITPQDVQILEGIDEGTTVVTNPSVVPAP